MDRTPAVCADAPPAPVQPLRGFHLRRIVSNLSSVADWLRANFSVTEGSLADWMGRFLPANAQHDAEVKRRAQLFIAFSFLGGFFGLLFAGFYLAIGHPWGAAIVLVCTVSMICAPWIIRASGLRVAGNVYAGILVAGFAGLTAIEGGIHGHAVAWLAVVPLCVCILVGRKTGRRWCAACLFIMAVFCGLDIAGFKPPALYPERWEGVITCAGYLSLTLFMVLIGVAFENGRRSSLNNLRAALDAVSLAKKEAESAREEAERANRAKSEFLSRMSHELRTPLTAILGFGQFLKGQETREVSREGLGHIVTAGNHLLGLINEVLDISRIESGNISLNIEPVRVSRVIDETLDLIRSAAEERQITLRCPDAFAAEACVMVDVQRLKQVLLNILSNAVKYNREEGIITISCLSSDGKIYLDVTDTGLGIAKDKIDRMFVAFDRLGAEHSGVQGTGLGLALSKCLIEALGGTISVTSEVGVGTTFRVCLPEAPSEVFDPVGSLPHSGFVTMR